ncbi:hypothetical protein [Xanthomonas fragariae]|uniref:hypothetical protein n=1 Tax=Xanthomonas fragariae TaxID=48664 RepID=UPI0022AAD3FA|nr:hypothetical protein [Xanthomonas fragariae]WAT14977.1 hypothetical protein OZ429_19220 [Xanthomonas fragariae]
MKIRSLQMWVAIAVASWSAAGNAHSAENALADGSATLAEAMQAQRRLAKQNAPIRSQQLLAEYLVSQGSRGASPIDALSPSSRERFIRSLQFNANGLASFYYADIERELPLAEAYRLLALFGVQHTVGLFDRPRIVTLSDKDIQTAFSSAPQMMKEDHTQYWCSGRATCSSMAGSICMSGC